MFCCLSHLVYHILLWQPELAYTNLCLNIYIRERVKIPCLPYLSTQYVALSFFKVESVSIQIRSLSWEWGGWCGWELWSVNKKMQSPDTTSFFLFLSQMDTGATAGVSLKTIVISISLSVAFLPHTSCQGNSSIDCCLFAFVRSLCFVFRVCWDRSIGKPCVCTGVGQCLSWPFKARQVQGRSSLEGSQHTVYIWEWDTFSCALIWLVLVYLFACFSLYT